MEVLGCCFIWTNQYLVCRLSLPKVKRLSQNVRISNIITFICVRGGFIFVFVFSFFILFHVVYAYRDNYFFHSFSFHYF